MESGTPSRQPQIRKREALKQRDSRNPRGTPPEGHAHCQFVRIRLAFGEKQAGNIRVSEKQNEPGGCKQGKQWRIDLADGLLQQRHDPRTEVFVRCGVLRLQPEAGGFELGLCFGLANSLLKSRDHASIGGAMLLSCQIAAERHPELHLIGWKLRRGSKPEWEVEALWHNAEDLVAFAIQVNYLADDLRVGLETTAP